MQTMAIVGVGVCLALLVFDFSRRWRSPRLYIDPRRRLTYVVAGVIVAAVLIINVVD